MDYLIEGDVNSIADIATLATESIDLFIQKIEGMDPNDPDLEQKVLTHNLMQRELCQKERELTTVELISPNDLDLMLNLKGP